MPTLRQVFRFPRKKKNVRAKLLALKKSPQVKGICLKIVFTSPKKPNSAIRKLVKLKLFNGYTINAAIPGQGHNLQEHSIVLVRGGRCRDVPGLRYKLIRGKENFQYFENFIRKQRRSKFGCKKLRFL